MVMALRTLQPNAEEQLADDRRQLVWLAAIAEKIRVAVPPGAPFRRDQLAHELVIRFVLPKGVPNPGVVVQHRLDSDVIRVRT